MLSPLPRWDRRRDRIVPLNEPATAAFPIPLLGRLPHCAFRGLLGVHSRYGLPARGTAYAVLCIEGFGNFVTSATAPIATGWNDSCRVGIAPTEERRLVTAHKGVGAQRGRSQCCSARLLQCPALNSLREFVVFPAIVVVFGMKAAV
jgi:hypothetical protein